MGQDQVILHYQDSNTTLTLTLPLLEGEGGGIRVDSRTREVWVQGTQVEPRLARKEFAAVELLYQRRGEACSKDEIAIHAWPERSEGDVANQEIEQCIRRLRLRVEPDPSQPQHIINIRGYGYKLERSVP